MELLLASSPVDAGIGCWDLRTGAEHLRYRTCASPPHGLAFVAGGFLASSNFSNSSSKSVFYWSWNKPQAEVKSFPAEPIGPLLANAEGTYLFGGGSSGNIYIWEIASGKLLKKVQAHYRSVTCFAFSDDESFLISGSEDGSVKVWSLLRLFDDMETGEAKQPYIHKFSEHSLRVTDVICGYGLCNSILISSSEDYTCKIWSLSQGRLLRSVTFPSVINAVSMDPAEHAFYAGGRDGKIYIAAFDADCASSSSHGPYIIGSLSDQSKSINCLAFSTDGITLVSGSEDGNIRAWDTRNRTVVRVFKHAKGPVNNVLVLRQPYSSSQGSSSWHISSCKKHVSIPLPPPLEKYIFSKDGRIEYGVVTRCRPSIVEQQVPEYCSYLGMKKQIEELQQQGSSRASEMELERLRVESKKPLELVRQWRNLSKDLYKTCVDQVLEGKGQ